MTMPVDLFRAITPDARLHPNFRALRDAPSHGAARALMNALYERMGDPNGNYLGDFQSSGFHARLFELGLFAYLESGGFSVDRAHERPDFVASRYGFTVALEAVTANPPAGRDLDVSIMHLEPLDEEQIMEKVYREFPQRMLSVLQKKLKQRYHELAHCRDKPLVLAVAPFFEAGSLYYTDDALLPCLYDYVEPGAPRFDRTPFFSLPGSESIAAVMYCNQITVPRFYRMSFDATDESLTSAVRYGVCVEQDGFSTFSVRDYHHDLFAPLEARETWSQGVTVFYNPNAKAPLLSGVLPCTSDFCCTDAGLSRHVYDFHPVTSFMHLTAAREERSRPLLEG